MHMAEVLSGKDNNKARQLIHEARNVIGTDEKFVLRRKQIDKLEEQLSPHASSS
jgi:hypothetical protein